MSIPINTDNSVQLSYSSFPFTITDIDNYATSNYVISNSNILNTKINTKQDTLTASTNILGVGSSISALDYNKITINKPTYFNTDWNTTITNKPTYFQTDWNSTIANKPTYFNTDWNTTITNKPSTFPATMTNIYTKAEVNNISNFNSNYTSNTSNILRTFINDTNTNISTNYLPKSGGTISGLLTTGNITISGQIGRLNIVDDYHYIEFSQATDTTTIMEYGKVVFLIGQSRTERAKINASGLTATAFYGDGANITNVPYSTITGKPTNFQADWLTTIINKPSTFPADMTNIYTKNETNNLLGNKQDTLTAATNLLGIGSAITNIAYTNITGKPTNFQADWLTTIINKPSTFPADMTNIYTKIETDGRYLKLDGGTMTGQLQISASTYNGLYMTNTNTTDIVSINLKNNSTYNAFIGIGCTAYTGNYKNNLFIQSPQSLILNTNGNATSATPNFIINTSGNVGIGTTNPSCKLSLGSSSGYKVLSLWDNGETNDFKFNGFGANNGLCFNIYNNTTDSFQFRAAASTTAANEVMRINGNGSVCIGTASATSVNTKLTISGTSTAASQPIVRIEQLGAWDGGAKNYAFQVSGYSDLGGIRINGTDTFNTIFTTGNNDMGISTNTGVIKFITNGTEKMRILNNGNVGISTNNPSCLLSLGSSTGYKVLSLWDNATPNNFQFVGFGNNGGLCFNNNTSTDAFQFRVGASTTTATELMRINGNGSVCIGTASATSTNTKLTIYGASYGYSQPLVNIIQTAGWDGNYALQVSGYTNLGGIRINGGDLGNSIYKTDAGTMGFSTTNGAIYIFVNGVEKAKFDTNGTTNISGVLSVPNITLGNGGKINVVDDYHYIQISQSTDTLTIQEYGTISFNTGVTKTQRAYINSGGLGVNGSLNVSGLTRYTQSFNYGETISYQTGFNATPSANGWFWMSNGFWSGYDTPSYLTIAIKANGNGAVWYGRAFLNGGGGFWDVICDFRTPNGASNTISVQDFWGSNGANALRISIQNPVYAGTFNIKISG